MRHRRVIGIFVASVCALGVLLSRMRPTAGGVSTTRLSYISFSKHLKIVIRVFQTVGRTNTPILAAGIAYNAALAFFPSFAALMVIASLLIPVDQVASVIEQVNTHLPRDIAGLVSVQLEAQVSNRGGNVIIAVLAIAISLIGAAAATESTLRSLNVAYGVRETRNLVQLRLVSVGLLVAAIGITVVGGCILVLDDYMTGWGVPVWLVETVSILRWPLLMGIMILSLAALYRYGPNRPKSQWRLASWGAGVGTILWLLATILLFLYTRYFNSFSDAYTLFAGIVVLMIWFNVSALAILIGAHINAQMETITADSQETCV